MSLLYAHKIFCIMSLHRATSNPYIFHPNSSLPRLSLSDDDNNERDPALSDVLIEDWIEKKSRYLGTWRCRFAVLRRHHLSFVLCTFKEDYRASSYKRSDSLIEPTEVIIIDHSCIVTTHDGSMKEYAGDRFNVYYPRMNGTHERCQFRLNSQLSQRSVSDWIIGLSKAKLVSQQLMHSMVPYFVLAYCARKYMAESVFPYNVTHLILAYLSQSYEMDSIQMLVWKWNKYHFTFKQSLLRYYNYVCYPCIFCFVFFFSRAKDLNPTDNRNIYLLTNESISKGNDSVLVDHTMFEIGQSASYSDCFLLKDAFNLRLNESGLEKNHRSHYQSNTQLIYHCLPNVLKDTDNSLFLPSVCYRNNHLFVLGGCFPCFNGVKKYVISPKLFAMDLQSFDWKWVELKSQLDQPKYGMSLRFMDDNRLLMIGGWPHVTKCPTQATKQVAMLLFNGDNGYEDGFDIVPLASTKREHAFCGIEQGIAYDQTKVAVASHRYLEFYHLRKNKWVLYPWKTKENHYRPLVWTDENDRNVLYVAGNGANRIEWIDVRENQTWKYFKFEDCVDAPFKMEVQTNFNRYKPAVVVI